MSNPAQLTAATLSEALPYIRRYAGLTIVIKYGGHAMVDDTLSQSFARDVVLLNKSIVRAINAAGGRALGLSGSDGDLMRVRKATRTRRDPDSQVEKVIDLGFVGEPDRIDTTILSDLIGGESGIIPVIAPVGVGADGRRYNVNADTAAGAIAAALQAKRLMLLTDVSGVLDKQKTLIREIARDLIPALIADETVQGGMIPKLETAAHAVSSAWGAR